MKSTIVRSICIAALIASLAACSGGEERKASFLKRGEELLAQRNFEKARLEFRNALQIDPKDTRAQTLAAQAAERTGEFREAAQLYNAALKDGGQIDARIGLARLMLLGGNLKEAGRLVDEGLTTAPDNAGLLALRGALKLRAGDDAGSEQDAKRAVELSASNEDAAALLASIHARAGRFDQAIAVVSKAIEARTDSLDLRVILAQLQLNAGNRPAAEAELKRIIDIEPKNLVHRYRLAQFYVLDDKIDSAEATLRAAMQLAPESVEPKLALASLIASKRSFEQGETSLKALVDADRKDLALRVGLGRFYQAHGREEQARKTYAEVVEADGTGPRGLEARNLLAKMNLAAGNADAARTDVEAVLKESPRDNEALVMRAQLAMSRGDSAGAITDLRAVLRDQPSSQPLLRALAQAYDANGDATLAEETLRSAVQGNPRDIPSRLALAQFLLKSDRPNEAQPVVDQLVTDQPGDIPALEAAFRVQVARRDLAGARRSATAIRATRPEAPTGAYLLGLVDEAEGKLDAARTDFEEALKLAPQSVEPLTAAVRVDVAAKQPDRALARIDAMLVKVPRNAGLLELRAQVQLNARRFDAARKSAEEAIAASPATTQAYRILALSHLAEGQNDQAIRQFQRGIEAAKGGSPLSIDLAQLQERIGRADGAIGTYEQWLKRDPRSLVAANNLAMLLVTHRSADTVAMKRALELSLPFQSSANAAFLDTLGWVRFTRGEYNEAVPPLQRAVDLAPRVPALRARLGLAQYKAGQKAPAKGNLESAFKDNVAFPEVEQARAALAELSKG